MPLFTMAAALFFGVLIGMVALFKRVAVLVFKILWWLMGVIHKLAVREADARHERDRDRKAFAAKAAAPWPPTEAIDAKVAFMDGETVTSIAARLKRGRADVVQKLETMGVITHDQATRGIEKYPGLHAALELAPIDADPLK